MTRLIGVQALQSFKKRLGDPGLFQRSLWSSHWSYFLEFIAGSALISFWGGDACTRDL